MIVSLCLFVYLCIIMTEVSSCAVRGNINAFFSCFEILICNKFKFGGRLDWIAYPLQGVEFCACKCVSHIHFRNACHVLQAR
jgi:hypothetical protein